MTENACWLWDFRQNMEDVSKNTIVKVLNGISKKWVFQLEKGKKKGKNGYKHWQGRMSLIDKIRHKGLMELLTKAGWPPPNFLKPTCKTVHKSGSFNYVMKIPTRIAGPWSDKDQPEFIPKQYQLTKLRPWQQSVKNSLTMWESRKINVIIDEKGNNGKTTCAHYCKLNIGGIVVPAMNDGDKILQSACCQLRTIEQRESCLMFIDMPRAMNQKKCGEMYTAIETLKGGWSYDWRNHWKEWYMDSPIIWVFTNTVPELSYITKDRWSLWEINKKQELQKYGKYEPPKGKIQGGT